MQIRLVVVRDEFLLEYPIGIGHALRDRKVGPGDALGILPAGGFERIAWCEQQVAWVRILDHGIVKPMPYPAYYWKPMKNMLHPRDKVGLPEPLFEPLRTLREAMPFDKIAVTMALKRLRRRSANFYFEYFRLEPDGSRTKLAFGEHHAAWVLRDDRSNPIPSPFPKKAQDAFLKAIAKSSR